MNTVINEAGCVIDYDAALALMDDELREHLEAILEKFESPGGKVTEQQFFDDYVRLHRDRFGEEFEPNKRNPIW